jgi:hypothetical protein
VEVPGRCDAAVANLQSPLTMPAQIALVFVFNFPPTASLNADTIAPPLQNRAFETFET